MTCLKTNMRLRKPTAITRRFARTLTLAGLVKLLHKLRRYIKVMENSEAAVKRELLWRTNKSTLFTKGYVTTISRNIYNDMFDTEAFKRDYPDLFNKYSYESAHYDRITIRED